MSTVVSEFIRVVALMRKTFYDFRLVAIVKFLKTQSNARSTADGLEGLTIPYIHIHVIQFDHIRRYSCMYVYIHRRAMLL